MNTQMNAIKTARGRGGGQRQRRKQKKGYVRGKGGKINFLIPVNGHESRLSQEKGKLRS